MWDATEPRERGVQLYTANYLTASSQGKGGGRLPPMHS